MTLKLSLLRWVSTLVGVQLLGGILWVLGPLSPLLEPLPARAAAIMALLLLWVVANLALDMRGARRDSTLIKGAAGDEANAIGAKLTEALNAMRKAKGRRFRLYEQPWYVIIGPPGAGKTTALLNSGLEFPLAAQIGAGAVAGVGGTRLCDWWFTNDAVLIDTAGRYTTQDSDRSVDSAGWNAFLDLLRRTRPRLPLNGVIVAIALGDAAGDPAAMQAHAQAIRARIDELQARLGVRMPIYALFTKVDLLAGFNEFFADLDAAGRQQPWGAAFPLNGPRDIASALRPLLDRLNRLVFRRLDDESGPDRRALIAGFPAQFASVLPALQTFTEAAFGPDDAGQAPLLRGVFLTSGTQEGTPIDRLMGSLTRSFGLDQRRAPPVRAEAGRAYFLGAGLRDFVFREAMLAGYRPGAARRRLVLRTSGFALCALAGLAGAGFVWTQRAAPLAAITQAQAAVTQRRAMAADLPLDPVADDDLALIVPWLNATATPPPDTKGDLLTLAPDEELAAAFDTQYRHALNFALLPRLVWRAEAQMRGLLDQPEALYETTRLYLMLGGAGPLDTALVQDWFTRDWAATLPGDSQAPLRADLGRHLNQLLAEPLPPVALDGPLVARARTVIGKVPLGARAWSRLKAQVASQAIPPWRPSDALGAAGVRVFARLSGRGLEEPLPGLYTVDGLRKAVLPALPRAAEAAANESWVLGDKIDKDDPRRHSLETDILTLYANEYTAAWDGMLADLDPAPMRSLVQAAQDLYILASAYSPLRALLKSAVEQLTPGATANAPALAIVDQHFATLRGVFGTGGAAPLDLALRPLGDLQQQLAKQAASTTKLAAPNPGEDPAAALRAEALRQPQPLARWLNGFAVAGAALRDGGQRGAIISAWNASGGPAERCPAILANHYPFIAGASADASVDDVTKLLGPGGLIDAFVNAHLKPYIDMTARPWKLQQVDSVSAPLTPADLAQFQRAAAIRDMLFPSKNPQPLIRFELTPGALEPGTTAASFSFGAAAITVGHNTPPRPAAITWPGTPPANSARLILEGAPLFQLDTQGPWALFRIIAAAKQTPNGDHTTLVYTGNGRTARFDLHATPNPFTTTLLTEFRCPTIQ